MERVKSDALLKGARRAGVRRQAGKKMGYVSRIPCPPEGGGGMIRRANQIYGWQIDGWPATDDGEK